MKNFEQTVECYGEFSDSIVLDIHYHIFIKKREDTYIKFQILYEDEIVELTFKEIVHFSFTMSSDLFLPVGRAYVSRQNNVYIFDFDPINNGYLEENKNSELKIISKYVESRKIVDYDKNAPI